MRKVLKYNIQIVECELIWTLGKTWLTPTINDTSWYPNQTISFLVPIDIAMYHSLLQPHAFVLFLYKILLKNGISSHH